MTITMGSTISGVGNTEYQFVQLDSFFKKNLFGLEFDYNPSVPSDQTLAFMTDLINQTHFTNVVDPDLQEDNVIVLVAHESQEIKSAFLALERVKRTQDIIIDTIEWQTAVPFVKYLHQFTLPTGEDVILGQDFLGIALKVNGSGFNPTHYQLGYANIPLEFLEFITNNKDSSFNSSVETSTMIQESMNELQIDLTYSNLTFLFQTDSIDLESLLGLKIAEKFMIAQFDEISYSIIMRKYSHHGTSGVETLSKISIGNTINLIINEELPQNQTWTDAFDYKIEENFKNLIPINETFSWYQGSDINNRLQQFSDISFSLITAQNIGVLNGTQAVDNFKVLIDDQNRTLREIDQNNFPVKDKISVLHDDTLVFSTQVKGRNFAVQHGYNKDKITLIPMKTQVIALNQQNGFADNLLFLQETSILNELVSECVKRFITDPAVSTLGTSEIIHKGGLDLTSAVYIQDFQLEEWSGSDFKINLIQYAVKTAPFSSDTTTSEQIVLGPTTSVILGLFTLGVIVKRVRKGKIKLKNL